MENKLQIKNKKFLTVTVLALFLLSATAISTVSAQLDSTRTQDQTPTNGSSELIDENPILYTAQETGIETTDENSTIGRTQDNSTASTDDSTLYDSANNESDNPNLIAAQTQSDNLICIIVLVAGLAAIVGTAIFVNRRQKKKTK